MACGGCKQRQQAIGKAVSGAVRGDRAAVSAAGQQFADSVRRDAAAVRQAAAPAVQSALARLRGAR